MQSGRRRLGYFRRMLNPLVLVALGVTLVGAAGLSGAEAHTEVGERRAEIARQIKRLSSEKWEERAAAMEALSAFGAEALPQLSAVKTQDNPELTQRVGDLIKRAQLATSGELKDLAGNMMAAYPQQSPQGRIQILQALVNRAGNAAVPLLLGLLDNEEDQTVQAEILRQLGWQVADPHALKVLIEFYERCPESLKGATLWAIAAVPSEASKKLAREALASESEDLQLYAIRAVTRLGDQGSLPALRKLANPKEDAFGAPLHIQALRALISLMDDEAGELFRACLKGSLDLKREGLRGLAGIHDTPSAPTLMEMFKDNENSELRGELIQTMGSIRDPSFVPLLKECLKNEDPSLRIEAILALHFMEEKSAVPLIAALLDDPDSSVQLIALETIGASGYREALPKVRLLSANEDANFRWSAIKAMANLGDPEGIERIIDLARTGRTRVTEEATALIGEWHLLKGIPVLKEAANRGDLTALEALLHFGNNPQAFCVLLTRNMVDYLSAPQRFSSAYALASLFEDRGLANRATGIMEALVKQAPNNVNALMMLSSFSHQAGMYEKCEAAYERIQGIAGTSANYLNNRSWFYCTSFNKAYLRPEQALTLVHRAVAMEPLSPYYVDTLGWALHASGKYEEAVTQLRHALALKDAADLSGCSWQRTRIARSLWAAGKKEEAQAEVALALKTAIQDAKVWFEAAGFYAWSGHRDEAIHSIHEAITLGFIDVPSMELNTEFDAIRHDPGWLHAMRRAQLGREAVERIVDDVEAEIRRAMQEGAPLRSGYQHYSEDAEIMDRH